MSTRRSPYSYSSPNPTRDPCVVSRSRSLFPYYPQQHTPPQQVLGFMAPQDRTHGYLYDCGLSSPSSRFPPQSMLSIVANPHLYNHHISRRDQSKGPQFLSGLVPQRRQHDREQVSPLPTPPSNNRSWASSLRPLGRLLTTSPRRWGPYTANVSWGASPSSTLPLPCSQLMGRQLIGPLDIQYSANIYSTEITSNECISEVQSLLSSPLRIALARSIQGNNAQTLIDSLDRVHSYYVRHTSATHGVEYRHLCGHVLTVNFSSGVYNSFPRSAKHTESYPHLIFFTGSSCALGRFTTRVGLGS